MAGARVQRAISSERLPGIRGECEQPLRILLLVSGYNGLTQATHLLLEKLGHTVTVEYAASEANIWSALTAFSPDLVLCPFLKEFVPVAVFSVCKVFIVHPGIIGDRGPSSIDWALLQGRREWGTVVVEAHEKFDEGPVWAYRSYAVPDGVTKSRLYNEFHTGAALSAVEEALQHFCAHRRGLFEPAVVDFEAPWVRGRKMPLMKQADCSIDWHRDTAAEIVRKVASRDGQPGVLDEFFGRSVYLYGAHLEASLTGKPKSILATRHGAVCVGAVNGAVWFTHMRASKLKQDTGAPSAPQKFCKLPAAAVLKEQLGAELDVEDVRVGLPPSPTETWQDIVYQKRGEVGAVLFQIYNGACSVDVSRRLTACLRHAKRQFDTRVIVVAGGGVLTNHSGPFCNGIDLNSIECAADPKREAWDSINAIDDACFEILSAHDHVLVACLCGSAGAGGVMLPLGADVVVAKQGLILNPHYLTMGLYGSEYWTYSLPRRVGEKKAQQLTGACLPMTTDDARMMGMVDITFEGRRPCDVLRQAFAEARRLAPMHTSILAKKQRRLAEDERLKPLHVHRAEELKEMHDNIFSDSLSFSKRRACFVQKGRPQRAPDRIAVHRIGRTAESPPRRAGRAGA